MSKALKMTNSFVVTEIKRQSRAKMIENVQVGDVLQFEVTLKAAGQNRGTYAKYVTITNKRTDETTQKSFNQLDQVFSALEMIV